MAKVTEINSWGFTVCRSVHMTRHFDRDFELRFELIGLVSDHFRPLLDHSDINESFYAQIS